MAVARTTPRYPRAFGAGAGLLAAGLLLGLVGGVVWGFLRPTYTVAFAVSYTHLTLPTNREV